MYSMPQPNTYGQYGFGAYGGFPNQTGTPGAPGPGSPGMPQAATAPGNGLGLTAGAAQPGADPNAAAAAAGQAGQAQWGGADPNSYYSNYWGGALLFLRNDLLLIPGLQGIMVSSPLDKAEMSRCRVLLEWPRSDVVPLIFDVSLRSSCRGRLCVAYLSLVSPVFLYCVTTCLSCYYILPPDEMP